MILYDLSYDYRNYDLTLSCDNPKIDLCRKLIVSCFVNRATAYRSDVWRCWNIHQWKAGEWSLVGTELETNPVNFMFIIVLINLKLQLPLLLLLLLFCAATFSQSYCQWRFYVEARKHKPPKSCPGPPNFIQATGSINWFYSNFA